MTPCSREVPLASAPEGSGRRARAASSAAGCSGCRAPSAGTSRRIASRVAGRLRRSGNVEVSRDGLARIDVGGLRDVVAQERDPHQEALGHSQTRTREAGQHRLKLVERGLVRGRWLGLGRLDHDRSRSGRRRPGATQSSAPVRRSAGALQIGAIVHARRCRVREDIVGHRLAKPTVAAIVSVLRPSAPVVAAVDERDAGVRSAAGRVAGYSPRMGREQASAGALSPPCATRPVHTRASLAPFRDRRQVRHQLALGAVLAEADHDDPARLDARYDAFAECRVDDVLAEAE